MVAIDSRSAHAPQLNDDVPNAALLDKPQWWRSGWVPAVLLLAVLSVTLNYYGVSFVDIASYGLYLAAGVTIPGTLIWRAITNRAHAFAEEAAAGTAVGFAIEVVTYIPARAVGIPLLVLLVPVATIVLFALRPSLRQHWRSSKEAGRAPTWHSWAISLLLGLIVVYCTATYFRHTGLSQPGYGLTDSDSPWYLATIGELKHHMPPTVSYAPEGPLLYHWFAFAEMAASSWISGVEPLILLRRLSILPYLAVLALLIPAITRKLTGRWWTGPVALLVAFFVVSPHPFNWTLNSYTGKIGFGVVEDGSLLRQTLWFGPPQSFGAALFAAIILLLVGLLRSQVRGIAAWLVFAVLLIAVAGAKASYLPLLLAGLACAVGIGLLQRKVSRPALAAAGFALACMAAALFILLGGAASGLEIDPMHVMRATGMGYETGLLSSPAPPLAYLVVLGISVLCWACVWSGLIGFRRVRGVTSPEMTMLVGMGIAGIMAVVAFGHPGLSQDAFLQAARPYLSIAAVIGFAAILGSSGLGRRALTVVSMTAASGLLAVLVLRLLGSETTPKVTGEPGSRRAVVLELAWPYLVLVALVVLVAVVLMRSTRTRAAAPALILALLMGMGLESSVHDRLVTPVSRALAESWRPATASVVSDGTLEAGRWIRDHSDPSDVVATNAHCLWAGPVCNNARFAANGFSERRVLLEGWGYNQKAQEIAEQTGTVHFFVPYWNQPLLAVNDAAFLTPSAQTVGRLRDDYGVRWLFVDVTVNPPAANLGEFAQLRFTSGNCQVYEIMPAA